MSILDGFYQLSGSGNTRVKVKITIFAWQDKTMGHTSDKKVKAEMLFYVHTDNGEKENPGSSMGMKML